MDVQNGANTMTMFSRMTVPGRYGQVFAGLMAACFAVFVLSPALASESQGGNSGRSSGIGGGVSITIDINKLNKKKQTQTKKKATKKKATKKKATKRRTKQKKTAQKRRNQAAGTAVDIPKYRSNHILALFVSGTPDQTIDQVAADYGLTRIADDDVALIDSRLVKFSFKRRMTVLQALELANDPRVLSAQPNYLYQMAASAGVQFAAKKLDIPKVHEIASGQGTIIAVIDSGVRTKHPALVNSVLEQFNAVGKPGFKDFSHGTGIASIIGARDGMISVAPNTQLLSAIVFSKVNKRAPAIAETYNIIRGVDWAVSQKAQVLNMSFTGARDPAFEEVLDAAYKVGVVSVAAVGNLGPKAPPAYPAAYPSVIAVTATDAKDRLYKHANRGEYVTVAAPGVDVMVAHRHKGFGLMSGTSAATAYVSGALALMFERQPKLGSQAAADRVAATARDLGADGRDREFGYGLLNLHGAVTSDGAAGIAGQQQDEVVPASATAQ
jgi:subtilisin family serine protease